MIRYAAVLLGAVLLTSVLVDDAQARYPRREQANRWAHAHAMTMPWHGPYYHTSYGRPVALVVPPTVTSSSHLGWGISGSEVRPMHHQYGMGQSARGGRQTGGRQTGGRQTGGRQTGGRQTGGRQTGGSAPQLYGTPMWPQNTDQFGVYYVRGPW
jgi:hypothetical protein